MTATLLPDGTTNGGLEGRELKSWHLIMKRHAEVIATANIRVTSKLDKHDGALSERSAKKVKSAV